MFKNRQDLFQEKSRRFHFKNNWRLNFMEKNGIFILTTYLYFVEEQTGSFDFIPRSGLIKHLTRIKCSPNSPLTDNPTVKGYVNPENQHEPQSLKSGTKLSLRQANCIDPSVFPIILARQFTTSSICSVSSN